MVDARDAFDARDLGALDRDVARTAALVSRAERAAKAGADAFDPYEERRQVAGRSTFVALAPKADDLSLEAPMRAGLRRWVFAFTLARLARDKSLALQEAIDEDVAIVDRPVSRKISWREAWQEALHATVTGDVEMYLRAAGDAADTVAPPAREVQAILREAAHRLDVEDRVRFETGVAARTLTTFARSLFDATDEISRHALAAEQKRREGVRTSPADYLALALGRSAGEGWPAKLTRRWLEDLAPPLVQGLALDVGVLPEALGASSFARALFAFGRALRIAGPSPSLPFALARDPFPVDAERFGLGFASLVTSAPFHRKVLGVGADAAVAQARIGNGMALAHARLAALRWLVAGADRNEREELGHRLLGAAPPGDLFAAFPVPRLDDSSRLLALATTFPFVTGLVDRHDEDWFKNPRALADLRARASAPAHAAATGATDEAHATWAGEDGEAEATRAAAALTRHFEHALA
jgi:hypothetical protein